MCEASVQPVLSDTAALISNLAIDGKWVLSEKLFHYIFRHQPGLQPPPLLEQDDLIGLTSSDLNAAYMLDSALQQALGTMAGPRSGAAGAGSANDAGTQFEMDAVGGGSGNLGQGMARSGSAPSAQLVSGRQSGSVHSMASVPEKLDGYPGMARSMPQPQRWPSHQLQQPQPPQQQVQQMQQQQQQQQQQHAPQHQQRLSQFSLQGGSPHGGESAMHKSSDASFGSAPLPQSVENLTSSLLGLAVTSEGPSTGSLPAHSSFEHMRMGQHGPPHMQQHVPPHMQHDAGHVAASSGELLCCNEMLSVYSSIGKHERAAVLVRRMLT